MKGWCKLWGWERTEKSVILWHCSPQSMKTSMWVFKSKPELPRPEPRRPLPPSPHQRPEEKALSQRSLRPPNATWAEGKAPSSKKGSGALRRTLEKVSLGEPAQVPVHPHRPRAQCTAASDQSAPAAHLRRPEDKEPKASAGGRAAAADPGWRISQPSKTWRS